MSGLVIQKQAGVESVFKRLFEARVSTTRFLRIKFFVSIASSMKMVWPIVLYITLSEISK